ncbi:DUF998 domain-containing protein [Pseudonocardia sp. H11422]|uniref:DUF998 domain-containing protein n=1 Tax=Pseudonocardia sp. H11422 TaxID=2835866 RepID=UPI001BDC3C2C|nr:DUF998 domain-containing protein [Pseudonocardia sp. H11422]
MPPAAVGTGDALVSVVLGCVIVAVAPMGFLHVAGSTAVHPLSATISDYAGVPGGYALLGISAVALAVAGCVLAVGLSRAGLPRPALPAALLGTWSAAMLLVAVFPTNAPGTPPDLAAAVHRYAGGWVFAALPLAGWLVARRAREAQAWSATSRGLDRLSLVAGGLSLTFLLSHVPIVVLGSPGFPLLGLVERVLYGVVIVLLLAAARATRPAADRARGPAHPPVAPALPDPGGPA